MASVTEILTALEGGTMKLEDAATDFAKRAWPQRAKAPVGDDGVVDTTSDPEPEPTGSWAEVQAAYNAGRIDLSTYARLADAAAGKSQRP